MKLKHLAAAVLALAATVPAYADINNGSAGNGELFLSVWHSGADGVSGTADDTSYTLDLGITLNDFASATAVPTANAVQPSYSFTADAALTSFLASAADTGSITWNIVGVDSGGPRRVLTTADSSFTGTSMNESTLYTTVTNAQTYLTFVNGTLLGAADTLNNGSATFVLADSGYAGDNDFGTNMGGNLAFNNTGSLGETLNFWVVSADSNTLTPVNDLELSGYGWTLAANGTLSYGALAAPVPEADTWAMLLAGLGMVGFMVRRRKLV